MIDIKKNIKLEKLIKRYPEIPAEFHENFTIKLKKSNIKIDMRALHDSLNKGFSKTSLIAEQFSLRRLDNGDLALYIKCMDSREVILFLDNQYQLKNDFSAIIKNKRNSNNNESYNIEYHSKNNLIKHYFDKNFKLFEEKRMIFDLDSLDDRDFIKVSTNKSSNSNQKESFIDFENEYFKIMYSKLENNTKIKITPIYSYTPLIKEISLDYENNTKHIKECFVSFSDVRIKQENNNFKFIKNDYYNELELEVIDGSKESDIKNSIELFNLANDMDFSSVWLQYKSIINSLININIDIDTQNDSAKKLVNKIKEPVNFILENNTEKNNNVSKLRI